MLESPRKFTYVSSFNVDSQDGTDRHSSVRGTDKHHLFHEIDLFRAGTLAVVSALYGS